MGDAEMEELQLNFAGDMHQKEESIWGYPLVIFPNPHFCGVSDIHLWGVSKFQGICKSKSLVKPRQISGAARDVAQMNSYEIQWCRQIASQDLLTKQHFDIFHIFPL